VFKKGKIVTPITSVPVELEWAISLAEAYLRQEIPGNLKNLTRVKAPWRKKSISEKQFNILRRMGILFHQFRSYYHYSTEVKDQMSCGEAADLITNIFSSRKKSS
jgi:hypothetical protein